MLNKETNQQGKTCNTVNERLRRQVLRYNPQDKIIYLVGLP